MSDDFALTRTRGMDILVRVPQNARLTCGRCGELLLSTTVALYTRKTPGEPFEPWCVECAYTMVQWAAMGADVVLVLGESE